MNILRRRDGAAAERRRWTAGVISLGLTIAAVAAGVPTPAYALDTDAYGSSVTVIAGTNANATVPVTVDLPVLGEGLSVSKLTFTWNELSATNSSTNTSVPLVVSTPHCVETTICSVEATLPTARMKNGQTTPSVAVTATDGSTESYAGSTSFYVLVSNPKPTVAITSHANHATVWGTVPVTVDAAPAAGGVPLKGVRLYLNPTHTDADTYMFDDTAPYSFNVDALDIAQVLKTGRISATAEDVNGNLSIYR